MKKSFKTLVAVLLVLVLSLSIVTAVVASAETKKRDIYIVLDVGSSVKGKHLTREQDGAKCLVGKLLKDDTTGKNRVCLVTFGDEAKVYDFTDDYETFEKNVNDLKAAGKSNMYAAMVAVQETNKTLGDPAAEKHMVIMTDAKIDAGETNEEGHYSKNDSGVLKDYYKYFNPIYDKVVNEMWDEFNVYTVAVTECCGATKEYKIRHQFLKDIQNRLYQEEFNCDDLYKAIIGGGDKTTTEKVTVTEAPSEEPTVTTTAPAPTTAAPTPTTAAPTTKQPNIPQTGKSAMAAVAVAAVCLLAGAGYVVSKKHED